MQDAMGLTVTEWMLERALSGAAPDRAPISLRSALGVVATGNPDLRMPPVRLAEAVLRAAAALGIPVTVPLAG